MSLFVRKFGLLTVSRLYPFSHQHLHLRPIDPFLERKLNSATVKLTSKLTRICTGRFSKVGSVFMAPQHLDSSWRRQEAFRAAAAGRASGWSSRNHCCSFRHRTSTEQHHPAIQVVITHFLSTSCLHQHSQVCQREKSTRTVGIVTDITLAVQYAT